MIARFSHTLIIARATLVEMIRERILYNIFFVSLFLLFFGYLAALLVYGHQDRVMLHFGTMVNAVSLYFVAAGAGARTIRTEIEQRTIYLPLSRPLSRVSYFFGKWVGIASFLAINLFLLSFILYLGLLVTGGRPNIAFMQSIWLIGIEGLMVTAISLWISQFLRPGLTIMCTLAYLFLAHNHDQLDFLKTQNGDGNGFFSFIEVITPNAQVLLMDTRVYYDFPLSFFEAWHKTLYGGCWTLFFLLLGNAFFYRKNL